MSACNHPLCFLHLIRLPGRSVQTGTHIQPHSSLLLNPYLTLKAIRKCISRSWRPGGPRQWGVEGDWLLRPWGVQFSWGGCRRLSPPGFLPCRAPKGFKLRLENVMHVRVPGVSEALICFFSRVYHVLHMHPGMGLRGCGPCVCGSKMSVHL